MTSSCLSTFEKKRNLARSLLTGVDIKGIYYNMLNQTIIIQKLKEVHSNNFFTHYDAIEKWLDKSNTEYCCKINFQSFLSHMNDLAEECEVIYFGIALLEKFDAKVLKEYRQRFIQFFSIYNIPIDFRFKSKFDFKRKEILGISNNNE